MKPGAPGDQYGHEPSTGGDDPRGHAADGGPGGYVAGDDRAGADRGAVADGDTAEDHGALADEHPSPMTTGPVPCTDARSSRPWSADPM